MENITITGFGLGALAVFGFVTSNAIAISIGCVGAIMVMMLSASQKSPDKGIYMNEPVRERPKEPEYLDMTGPFK